MRALTLALALAASAAGQAAATTYVFDAHLAGPNEFPPVASPGTGFSRLYLDTDAHTMRVTATFEGLVGTTTVAHIHAPTADPNTGTAAPATQVPSFVGFPTGVTSGAYDNTFDTTLLSTWNPSFVTASGGTALGAEAAFLAALLDEKAYINIHTTFAPGGEIRDFYAQVPEPATWALMIAGFGLAGVALRRSAPVNLRKLTT